MIKKVNGKSLKPVMVLNSQGHLIKGSQTLCVRGPMVENPNFLQTTVSHILMTQILLIYYLKSECACYHRQK